MNILAMGDNTKKIQTYIHTFSIYGFDCIGETKREEILYVLLSHKKEEAIDIVIIDTDEHYENMITLTKEIRRISDVPILMIGTSIQTEHIVNALDAGVDDYITWSYTVPELIVRVNKLLRKSKAVLFHDVRLKLKHMQLNIKDHTVTLFGEYIPFTKIEYKILVYLLLYQSIPIAKQNLEQQVYHTHNKAVSHLLNTHILNIRKKLGSAASIQTVHRYGFVIQDTV